MGLIFFLVLTKPIKFQADSLFYNADKKVLYLFKNVKIEYENITLFSDTVLFYHEKNLLYAFGNAKLKSGKDSLKGKRIVYNLDTQKGKVIEGRTKIEKGFLWAGEIYRVNKTTLKAFEGHYTTCDLDEPHYYFLSKKVKVVPKKDIIAEPVVLYIRDFPVLALPFWIFPATRQRKSGFLAPKPGRNSKLGLYIKNLTYYWAINPYMDFTIGVDLYERKGITILSNYVYRIFRILEGNISGTFTREINPKRERWSINGIHSHNLPHGFKLQAKADFISDQTYATDYSEYRPERLKSEAHSYLTLSKGFKIASFNLNLDYRDDYINKRKEIRLPDIAFRLFGKEIGPLRVSGGGSFLRHIIKDTISVIEEKYLLLSEKGLIQNNLFDIFNINTSLSLSHKIYPEDTLGNKYPVLHNMSLNTNSAITFYGRSVIKPPFFDKFYHFATLSFGYSYSPGFKAIHVKGGGARNPSSKIKFSLTNDYFAKKDDKKYSLLKFTISGNYDFLKEEKKLSNLSLKAVIPLPGGFSGSGSSTYNPYTGIIEESGFRLSFNLPIFLTGLMLPSEKDLRISGTYSYSKSMDKEDQIIQGRISGNITKSWNLGYSFTYSGEQNKITSQSLTLNRDLHCFALQIRWSKTGKFWDYQFRIWIKELPDLKVERNFFETILPSLQE